MILEVAFFMADETTEKAEKPIDTSVKARYWWAVLYQENMVDGWRDNIEELLQLPYAYCEHVADVDGKGEHRKDHVHVIIVFGNTTTYKTAMSVFKRLGEKALNKCERVIDIRHCYDYLIHDTDKCRKLGKHQYDPSERITGNGFDIGNYEQMRNISMRVREAAQELGVKRIVVGECRGGEIVDLLRALNSGHRGGMTTLHANQVTAVPSRLVALGLLSGLNPQATAALAQDAFDVVLHVGRVGGRRRIAQIGRLEFAEGKLRGNLLAGWNGNQMRASQQWPDFVRVWSR